MYMQSTLTRGHMRTYSIRTGGELMHTAHPLNLRNATRGFFAAPFAAAGLLRYSSYCPPMSVDPPVGLRDKERRKVAKGGCENVYQDWEAGRAECGGAKKRCARRVACAAANVVQLHRPRMRECGLVCREKNRARVRSIQHVPSKNHGASAPRDLGQVGARRASAR